MDSLVTLYAGAKTNPFFSDAFESAASELPVLRSVLRQIRNHAPSGRLLEVGCGRGDFLVLARTAGFAVAGCDCFGGHKWAGDGIVSYDGTLAQAKLSDNSFDIVVMRKRSRTRIRPERGPERDSANS
ncbi:MAG: methyltransferase domain-containing protein [Candidatus Binatia bacterium]